MTETPALKTSDDVELVVSEHEPLEPFSQSPPQVQEELASASCHSNSESAGDLLKTLTLVSAEASIGAGAALPIQSASVKNKTDIVPHLLAFEEHWNACFRTPFAEIWRHRVPLVVLLVLAFFPRLIPSWIALVLAWSFLEFCYSKFPEQKQEKINQLLPTLRKCAWINELGLGISQVRPFVLFSMYVFCAPFAMIWMFLHWIFSFIAKEDLDPKIPLDSQKVFILQNKQNVQSEQESNFFHSPMFGLTLLLFFVSGVPAGISYFLYFYLGIDPLLGAPSHDPRFFKFFAIVSLYIASVGCSLSLLFLRSWFSFPTNFMGEERLLELNEDGIRRHPSKGWFSKVLTINSPWEGAEWIAWKDAVRLSFNSGSGLRFYPLPEHPFSSESLVYRVLNKIAAFTDGVVDRIGRAEYIEFDSKDGSRIKLNLWEISASQRARIFYAVRKWAPHVVSDLRLQEKLLGSQVLAEPSYTQIWFDLLSSSQTRQRNSSLEPGDTLKSGELKVRQRIGTGGQATVYVAEMKDGSTCVLKEFVLSSADTVAALIESAADFDNEAGLLSRLCHPGIVKLIDVFTEDRRIYLMLEEVPGKSLRQIVQCDGPMPEEQVKRIALQICDVLNYLHSQEPPLVHRDLSPDNLVLAPDGTVKLIDFSLATRAASLQNDEQTMTITRSACVGKFGYTPPEQFREQVYVQSDIYAFGGTLHFLLTGKDPKPLMQSSPLSLRPELSDEIDKIIARATELELSARYEAISWLKLDLENLANK